MDILTLVLFALGFFLLSYGADMLVKGAENIATIMGISPLVVGLTIVAFGTSAPELAVNMQAAWTGKPDLAIGNIVGSNILNILLVLGIGAVIIPLGVHKRLVKIEIPLMIGASVLLLLLSLDGLLSRWDGLLLASGIVAYIIYTIRTCHELKNPEEFCPDVELPEENLEKDFKTILMQVVFIVVGLGLLVLGSQWLVNGAVMVAKYFGISELVIGLTIVSIGTSLPEIATVVVASRRGQQELVVGNVIGSNLFNILLVLGFTSLIAPNGIAVPHTAIVFDMPIMIAVAAACLPIFFTGYLIERWEGILFLFYYLLYSLYLFLNVTSHSLLPAFNNMMFWFVIPITVMTLLAFVWESVKNGKEK
ncbi:calcium/sodium antiporter [Candidatus Halobeggiatoa sp. HSG11]|nr:calcium/sodium antiporter [Candidatus Halobeggiatoa sp. HSG11]